MSEDNKNVRENESEEKLEQDEKKYKKSEFDSEHGKADFQKTHFSKPVNTEFDVIVVGGGLFGCSIALRLAQDHKVLILERNSDIFKEASFVNQNRVHYGFHYPRSLSTAYESLSCVRTFQDRFKKHMRWFENYYAVYEDGSLTNAKTYEKFAEDLKSSYGIYSEKVDVDEKWFKKGSVSTVVKVDEPNIDMQGVKQQILKEIEDNPNVVLRVNSPAVEILQDSPFKIATPSEVFTAPYVVNASYGNLLWHGYKNFHKLEIQFVEMVELESHLEIPGITIMDGPKGLGIFPLGKAKDRYWWASVAYSVHASFEAAAHIQFRPARYSNWELMRLQGEKFFPFMDKLKYVSSHYTPRAFMLNSAVDLSAARPSLVTKLAPGFFQVLSGKLTTSVDVANEVAHLLQWGESEEATNRRRRFKLIA